MDINKECAEMMGYTYDEEFDQYTYGVVDPTGYNHPLILDTIEGKDWNPSEDIAQAMMVAEWAREQGLYLRIESNMFGYNIYLFKRVGVANYGHAMGVQTNWSMRKLVRPNNPSKPKLPKAIIEAVIEAGEK